MPLDQMLATYDPGTVTPSGFGGRRASSLPTVNPQDFGADPLGIADSSPAFQAAMNQLVASGGGTFLMPAGIFKLNSTINVYPQSIVQFGRIWIIGAGSATILRPTIAPAFLVGGGAGTTLDGLLMADFQFQLTSNLWYADALIHLRLTRQWHMLRVSMVSGVNPLNDLYNFAGYLFNFDSSYLGVVEKCWVDGRAVYLFELNDFIDPTQQTDTVTFINCQATGLALGLIHAPTGATDDHNFELITPKHVMVNTWAEANVSVETTLTSSPVAGANTFTVNSAVGLAIGSNIWLGIGTALELVQIGNLVGTTVTLPAGQTTRFAHAAGDLVLMGGLMLSTAPKCHGLWVDHPHCEFSAMCVYNGGANNTRVTDLYGTVKEIIRQAAASGAGVSVERGEWHWGGAGTQCAIRVLVGGDGANNVYLLTGPFVDPNTGNPPATLYTNDAGTNRTVITDRALSSGVPVSSRIGNAQSLAVLIESMTVGGGLPTIHERDLAGGAYAVRQYSQASAPSDSATINIDASLGNYFRIVEAGTPRTIANPTNVPANGRAQSITLEVFNNSGGAVVTSFGTNYVLQAAWVDAATGHSRQITFNWNWSRAKWIEATRTTADT